jgi:hypothetical protein
VFLAHSGEKLTFVPAIWMDMQSNPTHTDDGWLDTSIIFFFFNKRVA